MNVAEQMRADWNERADEDAYYYVAFGRRHQSQDEFLETAADVVRGLEAELVRLPPCDHRRRRALEIGCGPGRLMTPMSWSFGEIHGVDVSDGMIRLAIKNLQEIPNAFPRLTKGTDLGVYPDDFFDFVYSYAVFQHIPSAEVVFRYLAEARRVLKPGGILRCQLNGLPPSSAAYTTWAGARIGAGEIAEFAGNHDMQLLALEGLSTQYMWTTMRKQPAGWYASRIETEPAAESLADMHCRILNVCNSHSGEPATPVRGRFASISVWTEHLPDDCDLNQINVTVDGQDAAPVYIGPPGPDDLCQVNALLPPGLRTGLAPVELQFCGHTLGEPVWTRLIPPGPLVPRIHSLSDGVNLMSGTKITSRSVKVYLEEIADASAIAATVSGHSVENLEVFCTDPINQRYEVNFTLPKDALPGSLQVELRVGSKKFAPVGIEAA